MTPTFLERASIKSTFLALPSMILTCLGWKVNDANLSGTTIANANLSGCMIENCRLTGMSINGVQVSDLFKAYEGKADV